MKDFDYKNYLKSNPLLKVEEKKDHEESEKALELLKGGSKVGGGNGNGKGKGKGKGGKGDGEGGKKNGGGSLSRNGGVYFEKLPPPSLPDKG